VSSKEARRARAPRRWNFDKPFYRRAWFWVWTAILIINVTITATVLKHLYDNPCTVNEYTGQIICDYSFSGRLVAVLGGGIIAMVAMICITIFPLLIWCFWTFRIKPDIRRGQEKADALAAQNKPSEGDRPKES
jgi:hypothetical protein